MNRKASRSPFLHRRPEVVVWLLSLAFFGLVALFSLRRHLHVDEVGAIYSMALTGRFGHADFPEPAELYIVLLSPLAPLCSTSEALWLTLRALYLVLLLALCVG